MLEPVRTGTGISPAAPQARAAEFARPEDEARQQAAVSASIQYSPIKLAYDPEIRRLFMQFRDSETGELQREVPARSVIKQYERTVAEERGSKRGDAVSATDEELTPRILGAPGSDGLTEDEEGTTSSFARGSFASGYGPTATRAPLPTAAANLTIQFA